MKHDTQTRAAKMTLVADASLGATNSTQPDNAAVLSYARDARLGATPLAQSKLQSDTTTKPLVKPLASSYPLQRFAALTPRVIAIGASTGGPQALAILLARIAPHLENVAVVIVLHMPPDFTDVVVQHIGRLTGLPTIAAANGEQIKPGHIYFAPGLVHLKALRVGASHILAYSDMPPENFCKPAVDVLFRTIAESFGPGALGVILTGMGSDGLQGAKKIVEAGGSIIAQDEASSVVWGMPGAIARAGLASAIAPTEQLGDIIIDRLTGARKSGR